MINAEYYFEHPDKLPLIDLIPGVAAYEILARIKPALAAALADKTDCFATRKSESIHLYGNYHIGEGTVLYNDVTIIGPVYIGRDCELMPGAIVRPYTIIGDGCSVGHGSEVKKSVMFSGSKVASLAFVGDSVLGKSARVGSGVITANRRFDQGDITLKSDGETYQIGDSYCGVILGDYTRLGANCVTQPGTHIGPYTWIYPMTTVRGFIPRQKRVYHPQSVVMEEHEAVELS